MKKIWCSIIAFVLLMSSVPCAMAQNNVYKDIYVDVNGDDTANGDKVNPFATLERAQKEVQAISEGMTGDIIVHLGEGKFYLNDRMLFTSDDSGKNGYSVIWQGADDGKTVVSGGEEIGGFKESAEYEGVWETTVPQFDSVLQLSVNGEVRYVAKSANMVKGLARNKNVYNDEYYKQHPEDQLKDFPYYYCDPNTPYLADGFYMSKRDLGFYENPEDIIVKQDIYWITQIDHVEAIEQDPHDADRVIVRMKNPWFTYGINLADTMPVRFNPQREFTMMNAMEFLDEPGEFYFNKKTKKLYYIPLENEDMTTAEVVVPKLENLVHIQGNDIDDKVKNVIFKSITFRDTKSDYSKGLNANQASSNIGCRVFIKGFRGIEVEYADNVSFYDNTFTCMGDAALELSNACENCSVVGNVFYDIGDSAMIFGDASHGDYNIGAAGVTEAVPESEKNSPVELIQRNETRLDASAYASIDKTKVLMRVVNRRTNNGTNLSAGNGYYETLNKTWFNEKSLTAYDNNLPYNGAWLDDTSYLANEKPWVKFEFEREFSLDEIIVSFDPNALKPEETSDFEILGSNDINFKEYDVIKTVNGVPESDINRYPVQTETKYRYIMIRSLTSKPFGVSRVWATTKDIKPYVKNQRSKNINIENNYCERIGTLLQRAIGLIVLHAENFKITHNEFRDIGYSGISIGFRWDINNISCRNMEVAYNITSDTTQSMHDGGGIYTLGPQPGSVYHNNYIQSVVLGMNSFYTDNGTSRMNINGNVMVGGTRLLAPYQRGEQGISNNVFRNNYGNHSMAALTAAEDNDFEAQKVILPGQAIDSVSYDTIAHAGLEDEYKNLKSKVSDRRDNLEYKYELAYAANSFERDAFFGTEKQGINEELTKLVSDAKCGNGLGMYPYECKEEIEYIKEYCDGAVNTDDNMKTVKAHELERHLTKAFRRYSFADTLRLCEEKLLFAKNNTVPDSGIGSCNKYPKDAVDKFEKTVEDIKGKSENISVDDEYKYLLELENAYNEIEAQKNSAEIEYIYADGASKFEINNEERTVKVYLPDSAPKKLTGVDIRVSSNAKIAKIIGTELDLEKPISIPIFCSGNNRYKIWTISAAPEETKNVSKLGEADWVTTTDEADGMIKKYNDNSTHLPAGEYIYMADGYNKNGATEVTFKPLTKNEMNTFSFILGAESKENQEKSTKVNNRCEIVFNDSTAEFYKIVNGQRTLIKSISDVKIGYDQKNTISYTITETGNNLYFKVWLNGELIFTPVVNSYSWGGYAGIYSRYMDIKIYK